MLVVGSDSGPGHERERHPYTRRVAAPGNSTAVLVPVKAFAEAKARLAEVLSPESRIELARTMASTVVTAAAPLPVWVVCDDDAVRRWAESVGAQVLWKPGRGLNGAVTEGVADLRASGVNVVIVAHADLPHAEDLSVVDGDGDVCIVPDRHEDGTNVIRLPTGVGFTFSYGPGSFHRHVAEAERLGLRVVVRHDDRLAWDVDRPEDLAVPEWIRTR